MIRMKAPLIIAAIVLAATTAGMLAKGRSAAHAERDAQTLRLATAGQIRDVTRQPHAASLLNPELTPTAAPVSEVDAKDGVAITRQRFQRAGLGSQVRTSFTLVNRNAFAVKDVAMRCDFAGPDGRYVSARERVLPDTVKKNGRKRVGPTHVGFVTMTLSQARCTVASANRA